MASNPELVYHNIKKRLLEFRETNLERQSRVEMEFANLARGGKSALEFLPLFEKSHGPSRPRADAL